MVNEWWSSWRPLHLVVILCDDLMHPAEVVVWLEKPAKLSGEVF